MTPFAWINRRDEDEIEREREEEYEELQEESREEEGEEMAGRRIEKSVEM